MAFKPRLKANGTACCHGINTSGQMSFPDNPCTECREHHAREAARRDLEESAAPNPYFRDLGLRDANERQTATFEEEFTTMRRAQLAAEENEVAQLRSAHAAHLTAAELAEIPDAPDPYTRDLKALQAVRR